MLLLPSVRVSETVRLFNETFPVFSIEILYCNKSPFPFTPSPLSEIVTDFKTLIDGEEVVVTIVGSLSVAVFGSSLVSETLEV